MDKDFDFPSKSAFPLSPSSKVFIVDNEFEFDAPKFCDLEESDSTNIFFKSEDSIDRWFEQTHWEHESVEKRAKPKRRPSAVLVKSKSTGALSSPCKRMIEEDSQSIVKKRKTGSGGGDMINGDPFKSPERKSKQADTYMDFSPSKPSPLYNSTNLLANPKPLFSPLKTYSPLKLRLGAPQRILSPVSKDKENNPKRFSNDKEEIGKRKSSKEFQKYLDFDIPDRDSSDSVHDDVPISIAAIPFPKPSGRRLGAPAQRVVDVQPQQEVVERLDKEVSPRVSPEKKKSRSPEKKSRSPEKKKLSEEKVILVDRVRSAIVNCPAPATTTSKVKETKSVSVVNAPPKKAAPTALPEKPKAKPKKPNDPLDDEITQMLAEHNKKFKPVPAYVPRAHSVKDVKMWEEFSGKKWYSLNASEREEANEWIKRVKKKAAAAV